MCWGFIAMSLDALRLAAARKPAVRQSHDAEIARLPGHDEFDLDRVEEPQAGVVERVRAQAVLAGQEREGFETHREREAIGGETYRFESVLVRERSVDRGAIDAHDAEEQHRGPVLGAIGETLQHQRLAASERSRLAAIRALCPDL